MRRYFASLVAAALWLVAGPAFGQAAPPTPLPSSVLCNTCSASLSVTNASGRVALPSTSPPFNTITIFNSGTKDAYFAQGDVTATATTSSNLISAGRAVTVWVSGTYVAAITGGSDTTTLKIYQSNGPINLSQVIPNGGTPGGAAGGDLSGTYPNPSVVSFNGGTFFGTAAAASTGTSGATVPLNNGNNIFSGLFALSGRTDATIAADQNNWTPTGTGTFANSTEVFVDGGAGDRNITGLTGGVGGRIVGIVNKGSTNSIILKNQSGSSSAANQFLLPADVTLPPNTALEMRYDGTANVWRPWGRALANSGVTAGAYSPAAVTVDVAGRVTSASSIAVSGTGATLASYLGTIPTYTIGTDFSTVQAAINSLNTSVVNPDTGGASIVIPDGTYANAGTIVVQGPWSRTYVLKGQHTYAHNITSVQSSSGAAGNWSIVLNVDSIANTAVNDYIVASSLSGGTNPKYMAGAFKVTNVDAGNTRITVTSASNAAAAPSGAVAGAYTVIKSILTFSGSDGVDIWNGHSTFHLKDICLVGDGTHDGVSAQDLARVYSDGVVCVVGFNRGIYELYNSQWNSTGTVVSSGNASHGADIEHSSSFDMPTFVASGNGGDGVHVDIGSEANVSSGVATGNSTNGYNAIDGSAIVANSGFSTGNGQYGYSAYRGGYISNDSTTGGNNTSGDANIPWAVGGNGIPTGTLLNVLPIPTLTATTNQSQASGGTALLPFASTSGISVFQTISGTNIPAGDQVRSIVSTAQASLTANGVSASGQAVLTTTNTTGIAVGQQCTDVTTPAAIGAGNVILSIQAGVSITMTSNLTGATVNNDTVTCNPVVTMMAASSGTISSGASIIFYANTTVPSTASPFYDAGGGSIFGSLSVGGQLYLSIRPFQIPTITAFGDTTTGITFRGSGQMDFQSTGSRSWSMTGGGMVANNANGPNFKSGAASTATVAVVNNNQNDTNTGLGGLVNHTALIANSINQIDCVSTGCTTALAAAFSAGLIMKGSTPTLTGTCTSGTQAGGNTAGTFQATCTAQTVIITFATTAPTGWNCNAHDQTTPADNLNQTGSTTTSCTLTGTTVASDNVSFNAVAF